MKQNLNNIKTASLKLNIADFLAEYFTDVTGVKIQQLSYGLLWDVIHDKYDADCEAARIFTDGLQVEDSNLYYEYGLLKAEEEMCADHVVTEHRLSVNGRDIWIYNIAYEDEIKPVRFHFYTKTRIIAFVQHENETLEVAWEMQEITKQKPVLCLESHKSLFCRALDCILEAYSKDEYSDEDLQKEYSPDNSEIAIDWMRYKFGCSDKYEADYCAGCSALETNVGYAIDAAWTWFRTGYVNNFISLNPHTKEINLNW